MASLILVKQLTEDEIFNNKNKKDQNNEEEYYFEKFSK